MRRPGKSGPRRGTTSETIEANPTSTAAATPRMTSLRLTGRAYDNGVRRVGSLRLLLRRAPPCRRSARRPRRRARSPGALSDWQALVLGVVQGFTELLPISSSGHLILVPWLGDWTYLEEHPDFNKTFDVALHLGTLVAVVAYFWDDIVALVAAWFQSVGQRGDSQRGGAHGLVRARGDGPGCTRGRARRELHRGAPRRAVADRALPRCLRRAPLARRSDAAADEDRRPQVRSGDRDRLGAGCSRSLPGVSRSGITITTARALRFDRDAAARFSFLLLVPIVLGAVLYKGLTDVVLGELPAGSGGPFLVGTLAAAGSGLIAIEALLGYVRRHDYSIFVVYRLVVAALILLLIAGGVRDATF